MLRARGRIPVGSGSVELALARPVASMADAHGLPGGTVWEPKWDGLRVLVGAAGPATSLWSRDGQDVTAAFPEVVTAVAGQVPEGTVLDGELVIWRTDGPDFAALQRRLAAPRTAAYVAEHEPAQLIAFDVLRRDGTDLRPEPFHARRIVLERLGATWCTGLSLSPLAEDADIAARWWRELAASGVEGLVAKGLEQPYRGGRRDWLKIKHRATIDLIGTSVSGSLERPDTVRLALPIDGVLVPIGDTAPLGPVAALALGRQLTPAADGPARPDDPGARSSDGAPAIRIDPIVVEVSADVVWSRDALSGPAHYLRARPDLDPAEVDAELAMRSGR